MNDAPGAGSEQGLRPAVGRLIGGIAGLARARLELASIELAEERERLKSALVFVIAGAILATLAVAALTLGVVAYFWETHRWAAIAAVAAVYALGAWFAFAKAAAFYRDAQTPFAATIAEFDKDRALFGGPTDGEAR